MSNSRKDKQPNTAAEVCAEASKLNGEAINTHMIIDDITPEQKQAMQRKTREYLKTCDRRFLPMFSPANWPDNLSLQEYANAHIQRAGGVSVLAK